MEKHFRKWGMATIAILLVAGMFAPTAALAWTPTGDKPIDNGEGIGPELDAVGDPDDGTSGAPQRIQDDFGSIARLLLVQYLNAHVDSRVLNWRVIFRFVLKHDGGRSSR